ncbi:PspC domain-containing protein [Paenibacillus taiwanensis]|uniref:PspC domain-containing protein n=1 Tax=Paenibacillus taiwanensis TaxID=401638 RepID=UPI0004109CD9|nr:PspC domain-containing protein [Paenibacillus taiwanensis]
MNKKLYRSTRDSKMCGLCGGLAEWLNIDATLIRVLFVIGVIFSGFTLLFVYFVIALVVPKEPRPYGPMGFNGSNGYGPNNYDPQGYNGGYAGEGYSHDRDAQYNRNSYRNRNDYRSQQQYNSSYDNNSSNIDSMMSDIEKKAMMNELQQLREKLAKYEKGDK